MSTLGSRLKNERSKRGWTMEQVAERLGLKGHSTYSNWEYDNRKPDPDMLARLAEIFETTTDYLIMGKRSRASEEAQEEIDPEFLEQWHRIQEKSKTAHLKGALPRTSSRTLLKRHLDSYEEILDEIIKENENRRNNNGAGTHDNE